MHERKRTLVDHQGRPSEDLEMARVVFKDQPPCIVDVEIRVRVERLHSAIVKPGAHLAPISLSGETNRLGFRAGKPRSDGLQERDRQGLGTPCCHDHGQ